MIPRLPEPPAPIPLYTEALSELRTRGFEGDLTTEASDRTVLATDNSIYQILPQAVVYPRGIEDLRRVARLLSEEAFRDLCVLPRGGGTGTNGQALGDGLVVDLSRHMTRILEVNAAEGWARVEAGVVKDQLNAALRPHGLFFAPELSTSNRATIGGMISTDASGQGSCLYGKTRDHVASLTAVLRGGVLWTAEPLDDEELERVKQDGGVVGEVHRVLDDIRHSHASEIDAVFPKLTRCLTGYDLAHIRDGDGRFDLKSVLCGGEGTLALVAEAKLRVLKIPDTSAIINVRYASFDEALRDARQLLALAPASIETIDSKVLALARGDRVWSAIAPFFPDEDIPSQGINFVEFVGTQAQVSAAVDHACDVLAKRPNRGFTIARGAQTDHIWAVRKRAVGLLGNVQGERRPLPFVEDTAVPPESLADYIAEFRAILDRYGLDYGMFGHVDAGVLHVRPALDLKDPEQEGLVRDISREVAALTRKYGGLLWGEHGKGFRSEFVPDVFGPLTPLLGRVKAAFDPNDQFNPGKIASAVEAPLTRLDEPPWRGQLDRQIPAPVRSQFDEAMHCNGNGACFNYDVDDVMCPSWKATRERQHSPKGRASLVREWLRLLAIEGVDPAVEQAHLRARWRLSSLPRRLGNTIALRRGQRDFTQSVKEAMDGCLSCKACAGTCPIKVDVPTFRAKFLEIYHGRYLRPLGDHLVGAQETLLPFASRISGLSNTVLQNGLAKRLVAWLGLVDVPKLSGVDLTATLAKAGVAIADPVTLASLTPRERERSVILVQDAFTSFFDTKVVCDVALALKALGFRPWLAAYRPNGKPLHVHGMLGAFQRAAQRNARHLAGLAASGVPLVGIDPAMTLTYRFEYRDTLGGAEPQVQLLQEWLASRLESIEQRPPAGKIRFIPHCTERATAPNALVQWRALFARLGVDLELVHAGCCGMAGTYGHETRHVQTSRRIFELSWARQLAASPPADIETVATGYSCRCQARRFGDRDLRHPLQALLDHLGTAAGLPAASEAA